MEFYNLESPTIKRYRQDKRKCKEEIDLGVTFDPMYNRHHVMIYAWLEAGCPYYNVWPSILPALTKIDLDKFDSRHFVLSEQILLLKLPKTDHLLGSIRTILICSTPEMLVYYVSNGVRGCAAVLENLDKGGPIGNGINGAVHRGVIHFTDEQLVMCSRLIAAICLIDKDNLDLLVPDVLSSDRDRFERVLDVESDEYRVMVERAARRKGRGFDLGKPVTDGAGYVVDAHPMLYHTGPGRKIPRIIVRKGWVSKRVKELPTGYDEHGTE